jgi:hypothetical protein
MIAVRCYQVGQSRCEFMARIKIKKKIKIRTYWIYFVEELRESVTISERVVFPLSPVMAHRFLWPFS